MNDDMAYDIRPHDLMNLATSDSEVAQLLRAVCEAWSAGDEERAGPNGPRIGTLYVEGNEGLLQLRLVTRLSEIKGAA